MDFSFSPKSLELKAKVSAFMDEHILPNNCAWERIAHEGRFPLEITNACKEQAKAQGLWNMFMPHLPKGAPGTPLSNVDYAPLAEVMGRVLWAPEVFNCGAPDTGNMELLYLGANAAQQEQWLLPLLRGEIRSAFAMTEPDVASSDATNIATRIERKGATYVVNGRKWFTTNAVHPLCKFMIVMGVVNPDGPTHARHSMIIVPISAPGVTIVRNVPVLNHISIEGHCEVVFRDVEVPAENLIGEEGSGFALAQKRLGPGRVHHCMRFIGQCELALELMTERALNRTTWGKPVADREVIREWIAMTRCEIEQARLLVLRTAWLIDQHGSKGARHEIALIKVVIPRMHVQIFQRAIQVFGAAGMTPDTPLANLYTWGRALMIGDGPDEVHLRAIAKEEIARIKNMGGQASRYLTPYHKVHGDPTRG